MRRRIAVNTCLLLTVLFGACAGCAKKAKDPLVDIKSLIPMVEARLNKRDLAGLKAMGTVPFESNALVIDVFGSRVRDSVSLALSRIQMDGPEATLFLRMLSQEQGVEPRELRLRLKQDGKWRIDSYEIASPDNDPNAGDSVRPDSG